LMTNTAPSTADPLALAALVLRRLRLAG
jgi:hypothetical protein